MTTPWLISLIIGSLIIISIAIYYWYKWQLSDYVPPHIRANWDQVEFIFLLTDETQKIVELNLGAIQLFNQLNLVALGHLVTAVLPLSQTNWQTHQQVDFPLHPYYIRAQIVPLYSWRKHPKGWLITLIDISEQHQEKQQAQQTQQLIDTLIDLSQTEPTWDSLRPFLEQTLSTIMKWLKAEMGNLLIINHANIVTHSFLTNETTPSQTDGQLLPKAVINLLGQTTDALIVENTATDRYWSSAPFSGGSAIVIPITRDRALMGALAFLHSEESHFTASQKTILAKATAQISLAIENVWRQDESHASDRQIIPYKVLRAVGESLEPETVAYIAVEIIADLTEWPTVAISMPNDDGKLITRAAMGVPFLDEGLVGRAFRTGDTQMIPNPDNPIPQFISYGQPQSALAVPLKRGRRSFGVLNIESDEMAAFSPADILLAESLADAIVLALDNARLFIETQNRLSAQTFLREAMTEISSKLELTAVLTQLAKELGHSVRATSAYICDYNSDLATTTVLAEYFGSRASEKERRSDLGTTYDIIESFPGLAAYLEMGEVKVSYVDDERLSQPEWRHFNEFGGYSSLIIPIQAGEKTIAYAELWESQQKREYSADEIQLCLDITQQAGVAIENARLFKEIEDERGRLQALIESDRDGTILISNEGTILVINQPVITYLKLNGSAADWLNKSFIKLIHQLRSRSTSITELMIKESKNLAKGVTDPAEGNFELLPRSFFWRSLPVFANQEIIGRLIVVRDITEARSLEKMREDLTHTMVHDLRSPLTSISITLDLLDIYTGKSVSAKIRRALDRARDGTVHLLSLINAILDISRLESGHMELSCKPVPFSSILDTVFELQMPQATKNGITLQHHLPDSLPDIWVDPALIERVMQNLVGNAIKFTPENGTIEVDAKSHETQPDLVVISVIDSGSGIPEEVRPRLFEKFSTGRQQNKGSGLGLAFCKMAIEAHGQQIWVVNSSEMGTTFQFTLSSIQQNGGSPHTNE